MTTKEPALRDDPPSLDPGALGGLCVCPCPKSLEVRQRPETAPKRPNPQHRPVQAVPGADLGTGAEGGVMNE